MPLTFPDLDVIVAFISEEPKFLLGASVHIIGGTIFQMPVTFSTIGVASGTSVPETTLELVDHVGLYVVAIDGVTAIGDAVLALVACMLNPNPTRLKTLVVYGLLQTMFHPTQPFQGDFGVVRLHSPSMDGFGGNGVGCHPVLPQISITGRSDCDVIPRVELGFLFEQLLEREAALLEKLHV